MSSVHADDVFRQQQRRRRHAVSLARAAGVAGVAGAALLLSACGTTPSARDTLAEADCMALKGHAVPAGLINGAGHVGGAATVQTATWHGASPLSVAPQGPTPSATITPAMPAHCRLIGEVAPATTGAEAIRFQVNLPARWNGRSVQYGGGGFNGVLINGLALVPGALYDAAAPLARGYATVGTDSGHQNKPNQPPMTFALNEEMLVNFAHAAYPKVRNVSVELMKKAYGAGPAKLYFVGSSEGGREGLTMAQRYPEAFDGIFSRVPVINWTGLQFSGARNGWAASGNAWMNAAQVKLVHEATLKACDALDGAADRVISNVAACHEKFDPAALACAAGAAPDTCLNQDQIKAIRTLRSSYTMPFALANGVTTYPGWGMGGEDTTAYGPTGGWRAWWVGNAAATVPPLPANGIAWFYGSGALQYFYAQDPKADPRTITPENTAARVRTVSALMDSTNPDLSAFHARGGKLIVLEHMADYAQSAYAGIKYMESMQARLGAAKAAEFSRIYVAPGVDHVGSGAPALADFLGTLSAWVEQGKAPAALELMDQQPRQPFAVLRTRPLCEWPKWPRYKSGPIDAASSFECVQ